MLDPLGGAAKRVADDLSVLRKQSRPCPVVLGNFDVALFDSSDEPCFHWFTCHNNPLGAILAHECGLGTAQGPNSVNTP